MLTVADRQGKAAVHRSPRTPTATPTASDEWTWPRRSAGGSGWKQLMGRRPQRRECATPSRSTVPVSCPRVLLESTTQGPRVVQVEQNCWGGGNAERQCYVDSPRNVWVEGGALHLRVLPGAHMGSLVGCTSNEENSCTWTQPFTSARINSKASAGTVSPARCARRNMHRAECSGPHVHTTFHVGLGRPLLEAPRARPLLADNGNNLAVNVPLPTHALPDLH